MTTARLNNKLFKVSLILVFVIFSVVFVLSSIIPHYLYRSHALDLGMFNHALYSFAHFKPNLFTLDIDGKVVPFFGCHFDPLTLLYTPFYYLFGHYTLLIVQIAAILAGGFGIFKYSLFKGLNRWMSLLITIHFFTIWGIYSALSADFHNNVVAAMMLPWFIYFFDKGNLKWVLAFFILILIAKENMALWMVFILMALLIRKENVSTIPKSIVVALMAFAAIYFVIVLQVILPSLSNEMVKDQLYRYSHVGSSLSDMFVRLWRRPDKFFVLLFEDTFGYYNGFGVKSQLHFFVIASGGFAFFRRPHFLVMLIPIYAQKLFSANANMWGIQDQYSIEFVPVISLAIIALVCYYKEMKWTWALVIFVIYTSVHFNERNLKFLKKEHYVADVNVKQVNKLIKLVPDNAIISVSSRIAPHMASRDRIYHYPNIKDAEYVILLKKDTGYPISHEDYLNDIEAFTVNPEATILADNEDILIARLSPNYGGAIDFNLVDRIYEKRISSIEKTIRNDEQWYKLVKEKATLNNIPIDSVIKYDAIYMYNETYGKAFYKEKSDSLQN